jgi:hypothetical protein
VLSLGGAAVVDQAGESKQADLELVRVSVAPSGAFGVLLRGGIPFGPVSLERTYPIAESAPHGPQFVKIPPGRYRCVRTRFNRGGYDTFEVTGVVGHERVLFHLGNAEDDSEGCVLLGQRFGLLRGQPAVLQSGLAFAEFMAAMGFRQSFELQVRQA